MLEVLYSGPPSLEGSRSPYSRDEAKTREQKHGGKRAPRRSQTQHEYFLPPSPAFTMFTIPASPTEERPQTPAAPPAAEKEAERARTPARRPPLGPPRRSYSVTDKQPIPRRHKHVSGVAFQDLPAEIHYSIMDFLDPIDSACLGLTNKRFYTIHRKLHGTVPLTTRRSGPNELEWAWHLAGNIVRTNPAVDVDNKDAATTEALKGLGEEEKNALSKLRVRGQGYCRMCGVTRCQLHKHIQEWMGDQFEYCSVKQKFGPVAPEGAKSYCYKSKPGNAKRCGRHFVRSNKVELR
ncbi:hypothetical protein NEMBOFW57_008666 [Staphylotrichum longicolle]|uniref:F-box domain-containing protein n=1 Tax=Staphylotrichum longicolle TaxID=669026 RepID=A0AAD4EVJ6_9PEZI|nr:hypothetical protein NEMBOFW57_008666 [Staphylotrichum longicolle]